MQNNVLQDPKFQQKFGLKGLSTRISGHQIFGYLQWPEAGERQVWTIAEWASKYLMHSVREEKEVPGGGIEYYNAGKSVILYPGQGKISLRCDTTKEYAEPRKGGEDWIHLLLEEKIERKDRVYLNEMDRLDLTLDFSIDSCENCMSRETYNPMLHAAQACWFFTVECNQDQNLDFEGRPDYLWFGIPLFDNRTEYMDGPQVFLDKGTEKVIYSVKRGEYLQEPIAIGKKYSIRLDILPHIKKAFAVAKEQNWLKGAAWSDMSIGSTNIGWEVPGTFRCQLTLENLGLYY